MVSGYNCEKGPTGWTESYDTISPLHCIALVLKLNHNVKLKYRFYLNKKD